MPRSLASFLLLVVLVAMVFVVSYTSAAQLSISDVSSSKYKSYDDFFNRPGPWDDPNLSPIFEANKNWIKKIKEQDPTAFSDASFKGHAPKILWIGCADARVPANLIVGEPAGSVFVHRNIANMVVSTDANIMSVIQYAVAVLKVKHIIVCGHYDCGGVKASMEKLDHGSPLEDWLRNIRDVYRLHKNELVSIPDKYQRTRRLVELNVVEQVSPLPQESRIQRYDIFSFL